VDKDISDHSNEAESDDSDGGSNDNEEGDGSQDDDSSEDEVDDVDNTKAMEKDIIKERQITSKSKQNHSDHATDNNNYENDGSSTDTDESIDDEAKQEAAKAAKYFDNYQPSDRFSDDNIEVFAQLNLSRPLLKGVASVGFVTPTPIQARVIPVVLSGRDVCAR
jgi:ATP-dependent RNA helicase DDX27